MTIEYHNTYADLKDAQRAHTSSRRPAWVRWAVLAAAVVGLTLIVATRNAPPSSVVMAIVPPPPGDMLASQTHELLFAASWFYAIALLVLPMLIGVNRKPRGRFIDVTRPPIAGRTVRWGTVVVLVAFALFPFAVRTSHMVRSELTQKGVGFLVFAVVVAVLVPINFRRQIRKMTEQFRPTEMTVTPEQITIVTDLTRTELKWPLLVRAVETQRSFLLYPGDRTFYIVPKRAFTGTNSVQEFRALVRAGVDSSTGAFPVVPAIDA